MLQTSIGVLRWKSNHNKSHKTLKSFLFWDIWRYDSLVFLFPKKGILYWNMWNAINNLVNSDKNWNLDFFFQSLHKSGTISWNNTIQYFFKPEYQCPIFYYTILHTYKYECLLFILSWFFICKYLICLVSLQ